MRQLHPRVQLTNFVQFFEIRAPVAELDNLLSDWSKLMNRNWRIRSRLIRKGRTGARRDADKEPGCTRSRVQIYDSSSESPVKSITSCLNLGPTLGILELATTDGTRQCQFRLEIKYINFRKSYV